MATSCLSEGCKLIKPIKDPRKVLQRPSAHMKGDVCTSGLQMKSLLKAHGCQNKSCATGFRRTEKGEALGAREALKLCLQATIIKFIWVYYFQRNTFLTRNAEPVVWEHLNLQAECWSGPLLSRTARAEEATGWMSRRGLDLRPRLQLHMPFPPGTRASFQMEISTGKHQGDCGALDDYRISKCLPLSVLILEILLHSLKEDSSVKLSRSPKREDSPENLKYFNFGIRNLLKIGF